MAGKLGPVLAILSVGLAAMPSATVWATATLLFTQTFPAIPVGGSVGGTVLPIDRLMLILPYIVLAVFATFAASLAAVLAIMHRRAQIIGSSTK